MKGIFCANTFRSLLKIFILIGGVCPFTANAQVSITEIMYDLEGTDTGREWIEIQNTGTSSLDIASWKLFEAGVNHRLTSLAQIHVPSNAFAVIADDIEKFKIDNPHYSGLIFSSAFSLSNEGETVSIRNQDSIDIDSAAYSPTLGGQGDGMSLQKIATGWIVALPTPGGVATATQSVTMAASSTPDSSNSNTHEPSSSGGVTYSSHSSQSVANTSNDESELHITSGRPRLGYTGVPLSFEARIKSSKNNISVSNSIRHAWSMGDGSQQLGQTVSHTYKYPGEYIVILNSEANGIPAVSKVKVKIVEPKVAISDANDDYVELSNSGSHELNIGTWMIRTERGRFVISKDTIVAPNSKIKIPSAVSRLSPTQYIEIVNPSGAVLSVHSIIDSVAVHAPNRISGSEEVGASQDMTEDAVRKRVMAALGEPFIPVNLAVQNQTVNNTETSEPKSQIASQIPVTVAIKNATTSSMAAAVIYTVKERKSGGLWSKFMGIFKK